jgi:hypothetical protein
MLLITVVLLVVGSARANCPIDLLTVGDETAAWSGLRIDAALADVQSALGHPIDLEADPDWPDPDWPALRSNVRVGNRPIQLTFHQVGGVARLSSMWIERIESDNPHCWRRESLVAGLRLAAPNARYLPSRHEPDEPETSNEHPGYALDDRDEVVVILKPSSGTIYVGRLNDLD